MAWSIRDAEPRDVEGIAALNEVVQALHYEHRPDRFRSPDRATVEPVVRSWLGVEGTRLWVAQDEAASLLAYVVAITQHRPGHAFGNPATVVVLDQLVVAPLARQRGIGRAPCEEVIEWASHQMADRLELTTWNFNHDAQALFRRLGFTPDFVSMSRRPDSA